MGQLTGVQNNQEIRIQFSTEANMFLFFSVHVGYETPTSPLSIDCWELCPQGARNYSHPPSVKECVQIYFHSTINVFAMMP